ncbi:MAG: fumarylacetoacetate hydrolase family protein [Sphingomonadaceae bacterium]|nr:fumarylacetoacetate hydrolase family protein [Sphingomonadaceae bacterium]
MKLATLHDGSRDGRLVIVSTDLARCRPAPVQTLQAALDDWTTAEPQLRAAAAALEAGCGDPFDPARARAPLPRAYAWYDGSAYLSHMRRVRQARGAEMPPSFHHDPLMYQGGSDVLLGPRDPIRIADEGWGIDFEAEVGVIVGDVPMGVSAADAAPHIRLVVILNDVSLRNLIPAELAKGFGFFQSKPPTAFAPCAVTPDACPGWDGAKLNLPIRTELNGKLYGAPNTGADLAFDFPRLIAHAAMTRPLSAGTIIGSGTVSNEDETVGGACLQEARVIETIRGGAPTTGFMRFGDRVRIEVLDEGGRSVFGAIDQTVEHYPGP